MTSKQYRAAIAALGLNQVQAGAFIGVTERTSRNYAAQGAPVVVEMLLRLMLEENISVADVNRIMRRKGARDDE